MRWWNETVAAMTDVVSLPLLALISFVVTLLIALGWYFWPDWLPGNWRFREAASGTGRDRRAANRRTGARRFRLGRLRWRLRWRWWRRKRRPPADPLDDLPPDELPDLPAHVLAVTADQLAAAGRYAEAVRERLRAIVRQLIENGVIPYRPGWTIAELAASASRVRPPLVPPLHGAVEVFSDIWYGLRPATIDDDAAMRRYAAAVAEVLAASEPVAVGGLG